MKTKPDFLHSSLITGLLLFAAAAVIFAAAASETHGQDLGRILNPNTDNSPRNGLEIPSECREYSLTISTAFVPEAGADGRVFVTINGDEGTTGKIEISGGVTVRPDNAHRTNNRCLYYDQPTTFVRWGPQRTEVLAAPLSSPNPFTPNSNVEVTIDTFDVGNVTSLTIEHEDWYPRWLVQNISLSSEGRSLIEVPKFRWFVPGSLIQTFNAKDDPNQTDYHIKFTTGDVYQAGTDASVTISIQGPDGIVPPVRLDTRMPGNPFERGHTDEVDIYDQPLVAKAGSSSPSIKNITLTLGPGANWYVGSILIQGDRLCTYDQVNKCHYFTPEVFKVNGWLEAGKPVILYPTTLEPTTNIVNKITFRNEAGFNAQMFVSYLVDGPQGVPFAKSLITSVMPLGQNSTVEVPSQARKLTVSLIGVATVKNDFYTSDFTGILKGDVCFKAWGTLFSPQGGTCDGQPVATLPDIADLLRAEEEKEAFAPTETPAMTGGTTADGRRYGTPPPRPTDSTMSPSGSAVPAGTTAVPVSATVPVNPGASASASGGTAMMRGQAHDIDAKNGEVWIIGIKGVDLGWAILKFDGTGWVEVGGSARRIATDGHGSAWVINATGALLRWQNGAWVEVPGIRDSPARDIAITNAGEVWIVTRGGSISRYTDSGWTSPQGMNATRIDYFANTDTLQLVDTAGKRWTRESATSWVIGSDPSGLAASYSDVAVDNDGTRWAIDDGYNIWKLGPTGAQAATIEGERELQPAAPVVNFKPRTITYRNEGGFNARLMVIYSEVGPGGFPLTKILTSGELMLGQSKTIEIPESAPNQMITVQLIGAATTNDNFFQTTLEAGFTGDRCFKSWGTLFSPQGGACK